MIHAALGTTAFVTIPVALMSPLLYAIVVLAIAVMGMLTR